MKKILWIPASILIVVLAGCGTTYNAVSSNYDRSVDFTQYKTFVSVFRNHKDIIFRIIPNNYINGIYQNIILLFPEKNVKMISSEASKNKNWEHHRRKTIFVFVIGEAARANNFSLNGIINIM